MKINLLIIIDLIIHRIQASACWLLDKNSSSGNKTQRIAISKMTYLEIVNDVYFQKKNGRQFIVST